MLQVIFGFLVTNIVKSGGIGACRFNFMPCIMLLIPCIVFEFLRMFYFLGIQFQIQRMSANTSSDAQRRDNPYRDSNIGVEKLLELNSEENHDDVCLAYIFTYRDFTGGVLGLAWVGEAGNG